MNAVRRLQRELVRCGYNLGSSGPGRDGVDGIPGILTRRAADKWIKFLFAKKGYKPVKDGVISLRMSLSVTDKFTDLAIVVKNYKYKSVVNWTTKPGKYWINNPLTVGGIKGTGVQQEGQWIDSHIYRKKPKRKWGLTGYFEQHSTIGVYRDGNKDNKIDKNITQKAPTWYGFFLHAMGKGRNIWNWSAGCCGAPFAEWDKYIDPYFEDGQVITHTIVEI